MIGRLNPKSDMPVFGDRRMQLAHFVQHSRDWNLAKSIEPAYVLDLGNAQQDCNDGQCWSSHDGLINCSFLFLQRCGTLASLNVSQAKAVDSVERWKQAEGLRSYPAIEKASAMVQLVLSRAVVRGDQLINARDLLILIGQMKF